MTNDKPNYPDIHIINKMSLAILCDSDNKCNLSMIKFKINPIRFIEFYIYL